MSQIRQIAQNAIKTGYLTVEAEDQLRQLLSKKYDWEDFRAFIKLQYEAMEGRVRQESRELLRSSRFQGSIDKEEIALAFAEQARLMTLPRSLSCTSGKL